MTLSHVVTAMTEILEQLVARFDVYGELEEGGAVLSTVRSRGGGGDWD